MGEGFKFDYYYGMEAEQFSFYRVPRLLIKDKRLHVRGRMERKGDCVIHAAHRICLEFPQTAIKKWIRLPKVPICRFFEKFRVAVPRVEAL